MALYWLGWLITFSATFMQNHFDLLGLRQVWRYWQGKPQKTAEFRDRALYKLVRHPLMLGLFIAFWSTPVMTTGHLLFAAGMSSYIFIGIAFEERDLLRLYGEKYRQFRKERPMLIPWLKF
jgi:protein-S-isoprenylcysteine O-methyltransferase Ste14